MIRALVLALVVAALAAPAAGAHYRAHGRNCGTLVLTPQSDHGASAIRATHVKCRNARRIVRRWDRGNHHPLRFRCRSRRHEGFGLAHRDVRCTRGERRVTFAIS